MHPEVRGVSPRFRIRCPEGDSTDYSRVGASTRVFRCFTGNMGELRRSGRFTPDHPDLNHHRVTPATVSAAAGNTWAVERQPRYVWLADQLRRPILRGELVPGTRLPSRTRLARNYRVSEQVSRAALRLLAMEGVVEARQGRAEERRVGEEGRGEGWRGRDNNAYSRRKKQ